MIGLKVIAVLAIIASASAEYEEFSEQDTYGNQDAQSHIDFEQNHGHHGPEQYSFGYSVQDLHTGDVKSHHEKREGDKVTGHYTMVEADGTIRHVQYTADKHSGFKAVVTKIGKPVHQVQVHEHPQELENTVQPQHYEYPEPENYGQPAQSENYGHPTQPESYGHTLQPENDGHSVKSDNYGYPVQPEHYGHPVYPQQYERPASHYDYQQSLDHY